MTALLVPANPHPLASFMSSRALLRALLDSDLALESGFRRSMDLARPMGLPPAGPAQESETGLGFTPVTSHFKQEQSIFKVWLTRRDAPHSPSSLKAEHASCKSETCAQLPSTS